MNAYTQLSDKSAIIFDFDGTIADTSDIHAYAFRRALQEYEIRDFQYENYAGLRTEDVVRHVLKEARKEVDDQVIQKIVRLKQKHTRSAYENQLNCVSGARVFIEKAVVRNYRLALATGASHRNLLKAVMKLGLNGKFKVIVTGDDVTNGKPDPEIYLQTLSRLDVSEVECVVIEDSCAGVRSALGAGIDVVCINEHCNLRCRCLSKKVFRMTYRQLTESM